ncbi:TNF receptor-associated factor 6-like [Dysidea avara]|uniref:TNF receptor-associated factor 6-like n=1 Tax=Dysidea avara TaxID=196820 RepID=UPI00332993E7
MAAGGYDYSFTTDVPDRLVCKICQLASRDPHLSVCCGHTFCKTCVDQTKTSDHTACPMCRNEEFPSFRNLEKDRDVKGLTIYCTNHEEGCTWEGEIRNLQNHEEVCPYEIAHCQFHNIGCKEKVQRQYLKQHNKENAEEHLALSVKRLRNLEQLVYQLTIRDVIKGNPVRSDLSMQLEPLSMMTASDNELCPVIVKLPEFAKKKRDAEVWFSNSFYSHYKGYKMCLRVDPAGCGDGEGTHMSVFLYLMKGPHDDDLTWPLRGKFEVKLLNQISDCEHDLGTLEYNDHVGDKYTTRITDGGRATNGWGYTKFALNEALLKVTSTCQYLKDDSIFFQVSKL